MQFNIKLLTPIELKAMWPRMREPVATLETPDGFIPEDVYLQCMTGDAVFGLLMADDFEMGFAVFKGIQDDLHIWQLKSFSSRSDVQIMKDFRPALMEWGKTIKKTYLTFGSTRPGWNKVAPAHGFKLRMAVFECPIE